MRLYFIMIIIIILRILQENLCDAATTRILKRIDGKSLEFCGKFLSVPIFSRWFALHLTFDQANCRAFTCIYAIRSHSTHCCQMSRNAIQHGQELIEQTNRFHLRSQ